MLRILHYLFRDLFIVSGLCFLLLIAAEDFQPGFVSFWFDVRIVLIIVLISGLAALTTSKFSEK